MRQQSTKVIQHGAFTECPEWAFRIRLRLELKLIKETVHDVSHLTSTVKLRRSLPPTVKQSPVRSIVPTTQKVALLRVAGLRVVKPQNSFERSHKDSEMAEKL
ncbi:hypothetical protein SBOR_5616 [Sclerotinia borealis F-4128]|uniref:Uncharacterized protein n=1 Tax=Sclerotinia borealis (strain F-4128) TaxID=1432307 RepID=W9CHH8_SCLBF|nr:hypothetical protein SBOR_5616 [Sclerotinia borealis F-4128]